MVVSCIDGASINLYTCRFKIVELAQCRCVCVCVGGGGGVSGEVAISEDYAEKG